MWPDVISLTAAVKVPAKACYLLVANACAAVNPANKNTELPIRPPPARVSPNPAIKATVAKRTSNSALMIKYDT